MSYLLGQVQAAWNKPHIYVKPDYIKESICHMSQGDLIALLLQNNLAMVLNY